MGVARGISLQEETRKDLSRIGNKTWGVQDVEPQVASDFVVVVAATAAAAVVSAVLRVNPQHRAMRDRKSTGFPAFWRVCPRAKLPLYNSAVLSYVLTSWQKWVLTLQEGFLFNHTTPFSTKCFKKSLTGTIFVQSENPVVQTIHSAFDNLRTMAICVANPTHHRHKNHTLRSIDCRSKASLINSFTAIQHDVS